jgi:nucleoside-diphosphate-sugar epimerase
VNLIKRAEKILQKKIEYSITNTAVNEIPYQHLNDDKIRKIGWKNTYSLDEVLSAVMDWYFRTITPTV